MWAVYYPCDHAGCKWADSHALWASLSSSAAGANSREKPQAKGASNCCSDQEFKIKRSNDFFIRIARANQTNWNSKLASRLPQNSAHRSPHARPSSRGTDQRLGMRSAALGRQGRGHARTRRRGRPNLASWRSGDGDGGHRRPRPISTPGAPPRLRK